MSFFYWYLCLHYQYIFFVLLLSPLYILLSKICLWKSLGNCAFVALSELSLSVFSFILKRNWQKFMTFFFFSFKCFSNYLYFSVVTCISLVMLCWAKTSQDLNEIEDLNKFFKWGLYLCSQPEKQNIMKRNQWFIPVQNKKNKHLIMVHFFEWANWDIALPLLHYLSHQ